MVKKRLYRNKEEGMIGGVCQGLSEYFDLDVSIIRIIAVILIFLNGAGIFAYLISWIILPKKEKTNPRRNKK